MKGSLSPENPLYFRWSDAKLLRRIAKGDETAFFELYARYFGKAFREANALLRDEGDADDLAQNLFADLWRNPGDFKCDRLGSFKAFLAESVRNRSLSFLKKRNRSDLLAEIEVEDSLSLEDRALSEDEVISQIRKTLSPLEARVVILRIFEGYSFARIAYVSQMSEDAASSLYHRSIKKLTADAALIALLTESVPSDVSLEEKEAKKR